MIEAHTHNAPMFRVFQIGLSLLKKGEVLNSPDNLQF